jgi:exodeoxyribonuclease-3
MPATRIATFNMNGVNGRLPVLLKWLNESASDIICLQDLKTSDEKFPVEAIRDGWLRRHMAWSEILQRRRHPRARRRPGGAQAQLARRSSRHA